MHNKHSLSEENKEMLRNQAIELIHHADELMSVLEKSEHIEPWVLAKAERATTDLSDITHYLEGHNHEMSDTDKFEDGGYMKKGGHIKIVLDEGYGKIINKLYNEWDAIKNQAQFDKWVVKVKNAKFGTYGTIPINEVLKKFDFDNAPIDSIHIESFKKELQLALNKYANGGYMAKGGMIKEGDIVVYYREGALDWENIDEALQAGLELGDVVTIKEYDKEDNSVKIVEAKNMWISAKHFKKHRKNGSISYSR